MQQRTAHEDAAGHIRRMIEEGALVSSQPSALPCLLRALDDETIDARSIGQTVERFPDIAARLVSLANSAWCAPVEPITTVERACAQLGLRLVRSVSLSLAIMAPFDATRCAGFAPKTFWSDTLLVAETAAEIASRIGIGSDLRPETARAAGLFYNLGLLWFADQLPEMTADAIASAGDDFAAIDASLRNCCGIDSREVGGLLGRAWQLPHVLVSAMENCGNPDYCGDDWQPAAVIRAAIRVTRSTRCDAQVAPPVPDSDRLAICASDWDEFTANATAKLKEIEELVESLKL